MSEGFDPTARGDAAVEAPFVSVVIPVKNGAGKLEHCLASLREQSYPADRFEVIVADGASTDATVAIARDAGAHVVPNARQTVAGGRNEGIRVARGELVAFTDDDCVLPERWLEVGVDCLLRLGFDAIGGPTPLPESAAPWSRAINRIFQLASRAGGSVQSDRLRAEESLDLPGGNSIYMRRALLAVFPVDEALLTAEDVDMHLRMRDAGFRLGVAPGFLAYHHKRDSVRGFFRQMRRFAVGRVQLWRKDPRGMKPIHFAVAIVGGVAAPLVLAFPSPVLVAAGGAWVALTCAALWSGDDLPTAVRLGPALVVFAGGWTTGVIAEFVRPMRDTTGR